MKYILTLLGSLGCLLVLAQNKGNGRKPMTEVTVHGTWCTIINLKNRRMRPRKALCYDRFNAFEFCQHPEKIYAIRPNYRVDNQPCHCDGSTLMTIRVPTEKLHTIALNAPTGRVNITSDSMKIRMKKSGTVTIPLNYKGKSFTTIKNIVQLNSLKSDSFDTKFMASNVTYINFTKQRSFIPSKDFNALDSSVFALKQNKDLMISLIGFRRSATETEPLAKKRAHEVQKYITNAGVSPLRIKLVYLASNSTTAQTLNRKKAIKDCMLLKIK